MTQLILKREPVGSNLEGYDVLEDGVVVGRIFLSPSAPRERPWMWSAAITATYAAGRTATSRRGMPPCRRSPGVGEGTRNAPFTIH
jgi:hypothetical protein